MIVEEKLKQFLTWLKQREESTKQEFRQKGWKDVKYEITTIREKFEETFGE